MTREYDTTMMALSTIICINTQMYKAAAQARLKSAGKIVAEQRREEMAAIKKSNAAAPAAPAPAPKVEAAKGENSLNFLFALTFYSVYHSFVIFIASRISST